VLPATAGDFRAIFSAYGPQCCRAGNPQLRGVDGSSYGIQPRGCVRLRHRFGFRRDLSPHFKAEFRSHRRVAHQSTQRRASHVADYGTETGTSRSSDGCYGFELRKGAANPRQASRSTLRAGSSARVRCAKPAGCRCRPRRCRRPRSKGCFRCEGGCRPKQSPGFSTQGGCFGRAQCRQGQSADRSECQTIWRRIHPRRSREPSGNRHSSRRSESESDPWRSIRQSGVGRAPGPAEEEDDCGGVFRSRIGCKDGAPRSGSRSRGSRSFQNAWQR
jgi:hypothetical protein